VTAVIRSSAIVTEQSHQGGQVGPFESIGQLGHDRRFGRGVRYPREPAAARVGQVRIDFCPGAFEGTLNGLLGDVEHLGRLGRVVAEHIAGTKTARCRGVNCRCARDRLSDRIR
jgi:hypothetical protein